MCQSPECAHDFSSTAPSQLEFSAGPVDDWWEPAGAGGGGGGGSGPFPEGSHRSGSGPTRSLGVHVVPQHVNGAPSHSLPQGLLDHADSAADDDGRRRLAQLVSLCRKARKLESQLQSRLSTLDEIMKMNKTCLADIVDMTGAKKEGREGKEGGRICRCSLAIMATCLDTMLTLFENVVKASWLNPRGSQSSPPPPGEPCMPSLHFGVFEVDPAEQAAIARRILARELRNYRDVVRTLAATLNNHSNDMFHKLMGQWCLSLMARVERLPTALDVE